MSAPRRSGAIRSNPKPSGASGEADELTRNLDAAVDQLRRATRDIERVQQSCPYPDRWVEACGRLGDARLAVHRAMTAIRAAADAFGASRR